MYSVFNFEMKKLKGNKKLKENTFFQKGGEKEKIDLKLPLRARLLQARARRQESPQTPQSPPDPPQEEKKIPVGVRLRARQYAKELGITVQEFIDGVKAGAYKLPERPSGGDPNVISAPDVSGTLIARQAADTIRAAAAPQMRPRLGGRPQAETDPLSQIPKEVPYTLREFALKIIKSLKDDQKKQQVVKSLSDKNNVVDSIAFLTPELLKQTIGGNKIDMDYIADLIIGDKEKAKAIFDHVRETKSGKFLPLLEEFFKRGLLSMTKLFPKRLFGKSSKLQYKAFAQSLKENKRYIKLGKILF